MARSQHHTFHHGRENAESKLSHLADLRARLTSSRLDSAALVGFDPPDKTTVAKARRKVLDQALEARAMTEPMRETPRARLDRRARYGHWSDFPVDPQRWYEKLAGRSPASFVSKGKGFRATEQLHQRLAPPTLRVVK